MLEIEALQFMDNDVLPHWPNWNPGHSVKQDWARMFKPYRYEDALNAFRRYLESEDYTIQRPKFAAIRRHLMSSEGKITTWFWLQNTRTGTFHEHYYAGDLKTILFRLFQSEGAPYGGGDYKVYQPDEITHTELFEYGSRKSKGLQSAIEHLETEEEAAYIVAEYDIDPRSKPAKDIKKRLLKLKQESQPAMIAGFKKS